MLTHLRAGATDAGLAETIIEAIWWKLWGHKLDQDVSSLNRVMSEIDG